VKERGLGSDYSGGIEKDPRCGFTTGKVEETKWATLAQEKSKGKFQEKEKR